MKPGSDRAEPAPLETASVGMLIDRALQTQEVTHLFTLNGGHIWPILQSAESCGIRLIDVRDERTAAFAAEGWSRVTRRCGVAAVTAGPGVTNTVSALAAARAADSPMLVLAGRAPKATWGMGALQEMNHAPVVSSLTKTAETVAEPDGAAEVVERAIRTSLTPRTGPSFVDIPADVLFASAAASRPSSRDLPPPGSADALALERAATLIGEARRPIAIAGSTVWWAHAEDALIRFLERLELPVLTNGMARGMLPPDHPLFRSHARAMMIAQADLVLVIGADLDFRFGYGQGLAAGARVITIDVDGSKLHRPDSVAVLGDVGAALAELGHAAIPAHERWLEATLAEDRRAREADHELARSAAMPIHPARLCAEVDTFCSDDAVIVGDGGDFVSFAGRLIHRRGPGLWLDAGPFGCLGSGLGYAMAAKLALPQRQVVVLAGDGAFGFCAMDFDTLVRHRIPLVFVIGNNGILALEKHPMERLFGSAVAADLNRGVRYDRIVEALGGYGELVERPEHIKPALERAFASGMPACLDVRTDPNARYPRRATLL